MRKFLVWPDGVPHLGIPVGDRAELTPITFEEFDKFDKWVGSSDMAFNHFLRHNNFHELAEDSHMPFNDEALRHAKLIIEEGEPEIDWSVTYGRQRECPDSL